MGDHMYALPAGCGPPPFFSMKLRLTTENGATIDCLVADTFWKRFRGLMGKPPPPNGEGLLIQPCNSIHMFFMRFSIDIVFMDREFRVVKLIRGLAPNKVVGSVAGAWQVLELEAGKLPESVTLGTRFFYVGQ